MDIVAQTVEGSLTPHIPGHVTADEKIQKKNDVKARIMLLMALPIEHLMTFNQYKHAKSLFDAITIRFSGNDATRKTQKTLLKQMYENFSAQSTENKSDLDKISIDDLYNNFKIVEQEVKSNAGPCSNSGSQNMAFVSTPNTSNNDDVSTVFGVSTASPQVSTANLSDATVYAFLSNQPNGSQLVHKELEKIHEDDLEEMDLKWQLALLSMRAKRFFQKTGKKITISGSDTTGYDKAKVECFNCHKMGHFTRECRVPRNQENKTRNQETTKRTMANDEAPTNMAFMAFLESDVYTDDTCSKTCLKNYKTLKTQYDKLRVEFNKSKFNLANYKRGLTSVEEQLVYYKKDESLLNENIVVLKRDILIKDSEIVVLKSKLEKISKETDDIEIKIEKFENASQSLDKLIRSQITDKSKRGLGYVSYNVVLPPHNRRFSPPRIDLSYTGLPKFTEPSVESYGVKPIEVVTQTSSVKISEPVKQKNDALLIKDWESKGDVEVESPPEIERKTVEPNMDKRERMVNGTNHLRVNHSANTVPKAVLTRTGLKPVNTIRPVNPKSTRRSFLRRTIYNNRNFSQKVNTAKGKVNTSRPNSEVLNAVREFHGGYVAFGDGAKGDKITGKGIIRTAPCCRFVVGLGGGGSGCVGEWWRWAKKWEERWCSGWQEKRVEQDVSHEEFRTYNFTLGVDQAVFSKLIASPYWDERLLRPSPSFKLLSPVFESAIWHSLSIGTNFLILFMTNFLYLPLAFFEPDPYQLESVLEHHPIVLLVLDFLKLFLLHHYPIEIELVEHILHPSKAVLALPHKTFE
nr:hypothetical protein [Tanacetum cinerariifolium]